MVGEETERTGSESEREKMCSGRERGREGGRGRIGQGLGREKKAYMIIYT